MPILELRADGSAIRKIVRAILALIFPLTRTSSDQPFPAWERAANKPKAEPGPVAIRQRLAEAKACLEDLDAERQRRGDSGFGKTTEGRIVWSELLELELQDIDEQVSRICGTTGRPPRMPRGVNMRLREGGHHGPNGA